MSSGLSWSQVIIIIAFNTPCYHVVFCVVFYKLRLKVCFQATATTNRCQSLGNDNFVMQVFPVSITKTFTQRHVNHFVQSSECPQIEQTRFSATKSKSMKNIKNRSGFPIYPQVNLSKNWHASLLCAPLNHQQFALEVPCIVIYLSYSSHIKPQNPSFSNLFFSHGCSKLHELNEICYEKPFLWFQIFKIILPGQEICYCVTNSHKNIVFELFHKEKIICDCMLSPVQFGANSTSHISFSASSPFAQSFRLSSSIPSFNHIYLQRLDRELRLRLRAIVSFLGVGSKYPSVSTVSVLRARPGPGALGASPSSSNGKRDTVRPL